MIHSKEKTILNVDLFLVEPMRLTFYKGIKYHSGAYVVFLMRLTFHKWESQGRMLQPLWLLPLLFHDNLGLSWNHNNSPPHLLLISHRILIIR